jgi:hypothetical protein
MQRWMAPPSTQPNEFWLSFENVFQKLLDM